MNTERNGAVLAGAAMISSHGSASMDPAPRRSVRRERVRWRRKFISQGLRFDFEIAKGIAGHDLRDEGGEPIAISLRLLHNALDGGDVIVVHRTSKGVGEKMLGQASDEFIPFRPTQHVLEA